MTMLRAAALALLLVAAPAAAQVKLTPAAPGATTAPNPAGLTLEIAPGPIVPTGAQVWFKVSAKKPGYLVLVDIDATGTLRQIYPNLQSLRVPLGASSESNRITPGKTITVPDPQSPIANFEFVAEPPAGPGMVVALLSQRPVQLVDLPEVPREALGKPEAAEFVYKAAQELRIAAEENYRLADPQWSLAALYYTIR
jgi:hypothetical protein